MLKRKLFRSALQYKAQFISMIIMITIGIGIFVGFNMEWYSLKKDTGQFLTATNYADYRIMSEQGFSEEDISAIKNINGVTKASRVLNVNVDVKNEDKSLALFSVEEYVVSTLHISKGQEYDENSDGFYLSDKYAMANKINIGDTLSLTYRNIDLSGTIVGLVKSSEFLVCVSGSNQLMPNYSMFGFVYVSPAKIKKTLGDFIIYPQINIISNLEKAEMELALKKALGKTTLVLSKEEHASYAAAKSEIEEGQTMVSVLPILFLLIGMLTMITTMHRLTTNEKMQIGTLKALGFKNRKILLHYTSYGLFIGIIGSILGVGIGTGICSLIINPNMFQGTYFDMPSWGIFAPWWTWVLLIAIIAFLTLISFLSVKKILRGTASETLRPYTPKKVKPLVVEKTKIWNKLEFATKWNLRDVFRHKTRSLMTLIGIIGCMLLLVGGLGMKDTMTGFINSIDKQALNYTTQINLNESISNNQAIKIANQYNGDYVASSSVQINGNPVTLEVYSVEHNYVRFINKNNKNVTLNDDGVYICLRIANKGYSVGDTLTFSPYGDEQNYSVKVAGIIRSCTIENIVMTTKYAESVNIPYKISSVLTNTPQNEISSNEYISGTQTKSMIIDSYNNFTSILNIMVLIIILAAIVLGIVVLYNLGVMSYVERYHELATLKVVGFKSKHIGKILISQNIWLTIIGIIIGLPAGVGVLQILLIMLGNEYELKISLGILTYSVSILLTFTVSILVSLLISRKNKKINMTEALKGTD